MPYIKLKDRLDIKTGLRTPKTAGELNYLLTITCRQYVKDLGECYQSYNDIMGALEGCKLEWYRRGIAPYEDKKIVENGDLE